MSGIVGDLVIGGFLFVFGIVGMIDGFVVNFVIGFNNVCYIDFGLVIVEVGVDIKIIGFLVFFVSFVLIVGLVIINKVDVLILEYLFGVIVLVEV